MIFGVILGPLGWIIEGLLPTKHVTTAHYPPGFRTAGPRTLAEALRPESERKIHVNRAKKILPL